MDNISQRFVNKLYRMSGETFPEKVMEKARECFCDYLFVTFAGSKIYIEIQKRFLEENRVTGDCQVIGHSKRADVCTAAMLNAFNAHVLELDDSHRVAMTHVGAPIFSALLGAAQMYEVTLNKLLQAAVIGYEASIRLANAIQPSHKLKGFHVSGTCCTVGCAMGIAAMLGYSEQEMRNVLSAAATSAAGLLGVSSGKSQQKPYNTANAAYAGVNAALFGNSMPIIFFALCFINASNIYVGAVIVVINSRLRNHHSIIRFIIGNCRLYIIAGYQLVTIIRNISINGNSCSICIN